MNLYAFGCIAVLFLVIGFMLVRFSRPEVPLRVRGGNRRPTMGRSKPLMRR